MKKINIFFLSLFFSVVASAQHTVLQKIIESVPSPVEISTLLKETGSEYQKSILSDASKSATYSKEYSQAVALGVYSTDLGYSNIYGKSADAFGYLNGIKKLADKLEVGDLINMATILKLAQSTNNLNALLAETSATFEKINARFQQNDKSYLSVAMLSAGWVETLYLMCSIAKDTDNKDLKSRIIDQQIILKELMAAIDEENSEGELSKLKEQLSKLSDWYSNDKFAIKVVSGQTTVSDENGIAVAEGGAEEKDIELSGGDLDEVFTIVKGIRNEMK